MVNKVNCKHKGDLDVVVTAIKDNVEVSNDTIVDNSFEFQTKDNILELISEFIDITEYEFIYSYMESRDIAMLYKIGSSVQFIGEVNLNDIL